MTQGPEGPQDQMPVPTWQRAPYAALTVDPADLVTRLNDAAHALLGAVDGTPLADAVPGWLARAHAAFVAAPPASPPAPVRGPLGDRTVDAHAERQDDGGAVWWLLDVTEHERLARTLSRERERTAFLVEASNELLSSLNLERCMEVTVRLAARHLADAALLVLPRSGHGHPVAYCGPDGLPRRETLALDPAEMPGLAEALQGFPPVPSRWIDPGGAPAWAHREDLGEPGAMVVTALPGHGVPAGALILLRGGGRETFSEDEEVFARLFAARAGAAMSSARLYAEQAAITDTLMRELLPPRAHHLDGAEVAARYQPSGATERVGGDFYDLYPVTDGDPDAEPLVVLGDVCGKGLEAAVLTGKVRHALQALLPMAGDHQGMLGMLNRVMLRDDSTRFVTLVLASVRPVGPQLRIRLTSAGHVPPYIVRGDGRVETVETRGSLIGVLDEIVATTRTVTLEPGDTCLLYTDGITEATGGPLGDEQFGHDRLREELARCAGMPPEALAERVHMLASRWGGDGPHDDMAVIAITAPRRHHLSAVDGHGPGRFTT
ncbi:PP2C family protein-serine/threonine phosphatase [Actinomadura kijaniata]|uniref:PP2C family protein-serine/threonine phosphatase n=1 Tax=Actinomadura kijaniata TaxID=46161 RepID=UPI003F1D9783